MATLSVTENTTIDISEGLNVTTSEVALDATETGVSNATEIKLATEGSIY